MKQLRNINLKQKTGVSNKNFKQWHQEQRVLMNLETLKLRNQNLVNKGIYDNLQQQKEQVLKYPCYGFYSWRTYVTTVIIKYFR